MLIHIRGRETLFYTLYIFKALLFAITPASQEACCLLVLPPEYLSDGQKLPFVDAAVLIKGLSTATSYLGVEGGVELLLACQSNGVEAAVCWEVVCPCFPALL